MQLLRDRTVDFGPANRQLSLEGHFAGRTPSLPAHFLALLPLRIKRPRHSFPSPYQSDYKGRGKYSLPVEWPGEGRVRETQLRKNLSPEWLQA